MTRLFYRIEDKIYFDQKAFVAMAENNAVDIDQIYEEFGVGQHIDRPFIEV